MYGQKQILSCLVVVVMVALLNFYKTVIKRDKEQRAYAEQTRQERMLQQELKALQLKQQEANRNEFMTKWLEYGDRCCDLHALIFRPSEYESSASVVWSSNSATNAENSTTRASITGPVKEMPTILSIVKDDVPTIPDVSSPHPCLGPEKKGLDHSGNKVAGDLSGGIIYVAVFVLLVSLGKAAYDLSKQFKELQKTKTLSEDEVLRRCSLQEYSLIKHKQKQSAKALEPFLKQSGLVLRPQLSLDSGSEQTHQLQRELVRRLSTNPQDYNNGSGLISEPGTPVKPGKLLDLGTSRRPSMDSVSEDDASGHPAETKRRVRMIHRH